MENHELIEGMDAAIRILTAVRSDLCRGSLTLWRLVDHAEHHLDKQIRELLAPPPVVDVCLAATDSRRPRRWAWWLGLVVFLAAVLVIALG